MVLLVRFELQLGSLSIKHERGTDGVSISFEFESFADGKLYLLDMDQPQLEAHHKVFAFDATIAIDMTSEKPIETRILAGPRPDQTITKLTYGVDIKGRRQQIVFNLPEKEYPEGSLSKVIDLERQIRMHQRVYEELRAEIKELRAERELRLQEESEKQIVQVPFDKLMISKADAHVRMKIPGAYLYDEYKQHMSRQENASVDQILDAFFDDGDKRLMFNMHYLNRERGMDFIAAAEISYALKCMTPHGNHIYDLIGWSGSGFTFVVSKTRKIRSYSIPDRGRLIGIEYSRLITFESGSMFGFVKNANDPRFLLGSSHFVCMIIQK